MYLLIHHLLLKVLKLTSSIIKFIGTTKSVCLYIYIITNRSIILIYYYYYYYYYHYHYHYYLFTIFHIFFIFLSYLHIFQKIALHIAYTLPCYRTQDAVALHMSVCRTNKKKSTQRPVLFFFFFFFFFIFGFIVNFSVFIFHEQVIFAIFFCFLIVNSSYELIENRQVSIILNNN